MTSLYYDIDGQPVPAKECIWAYIAPCGCECAWSVTEGYCSTADEAWNSFSRTKAVRKRDEARGFRVEIKRRSDIRISDKCPHTPRLGVEPRPELEGHTWAVKYEGRNLHLVPLKIERDNYRFCDEGVPSLCGRVEARGWSTDIGDIDGLVECVGCLRAAKERVA